MPDGNQVRSQVGLHTGCAAGIEWRLPAIQKPFASALSMPMSPITTRV
jgi:hypothetical protein